jgi:ATP-dependent DNA ligase
LSVPSARRGIRFGNARINGVEELVVGEKRDGDFYFVVSIKNGFVLSTRQKVFDAIKGREIEKCPFMNLPEKKGPHRMDREKMATVRWLRLRIVAEIAFNERTNAGHPRHSKFFACGIVQMYAQKRGQTRNKATTL